MTRVLLPLLLILMLCGCVRERVGYYGDSVDGRSVEHTIDLIIATQLRKYDPSLTFEPGRCPDHIDVSQGKTATCTLTVEGEPLDVIVSYGGPPQQYDVRLAGAFFEKRHVEQFVSDQLKAHGVTATVECPGAPVSLLKPGATVACAIAGSNMRSSVSVSAGHNGGLEYGLPTQLRTTPVDQALLTASREHLAGRPAIIAGPLVEAFLDQAIPDGKARCPAQVDLSGSKRATCKTSANGYDVRQSVWIDAAGSIHWRPLDAVVAMPHVQDQATKLLDVMLREDGTTSTAQVDCGSGTRVIAVPGRFFCSLTIDGKPLMRFGNRAQVRVDVLDGTGKFDIALVAGGVVLE